MAEERETRNQVFSGAPKDVDPRIKSMSQAEAVKAEFGLDIPVEIVPLPSAGKVYPADHPLCNLETVEIRAMTAREEDILTSRALLKKGTVITELIRSCLTDQRIDPVDMLTGDRNALMVAIRVTGYGSDYDAEVTCGECEVKASHQFDLLSLPIRRISIEPVQPGLNLFEFKLPRSQKVIRFKFLTGRDEETMMATQEKQKKLGMNSDNSVTTSLLYSVVSIEGVEDRAKIAGFIRSMLAMDSKALREYIRDNEPGIIMKQETECPSCHAKEEITMPIGVTFLWPSANR